VRFPSGVPVSCERKPGYWDGPYEYIDEEGNWVYSSKDTKVDIYCVDIEEYISEMIDTYSIPAWEEISKKFIFSLTYSIPAQRKEREECVLRTAKKVYDELVEIEIKHRTEAEERALQRSLEGWRWFQDKRVEDPTLCPNLHHYYTWKVFDSKGKEQSSNLYNVEAVYKSGLFKREDNDNVPGFFEWIKI
jgi:hypothetical protein